jgi:crossover junction endodeoxyribonuclease RuvC
LKVLGIDPGVRGGWAVVDATGGLLSAGDLPTAGEAAREMVSGPLLAAVVRGFDPTFAVIERVGAMPGQGVSSMFKFGRAVGTVEGVLGACGVRVLYVQPTVWKRAYGLPSDKEPARQRAVELWPAAASLHFSRKKDHGRAEAALIAAWGRRVAIANGDLVVEVTDE